MSCFFLNFIKRSFISLLSPYNYSSLNYEMLGEHWWRFRDVEKSNIHADSVLVVLVVWFYPCSWGIECKCLALYGNLFKVVVGLVLEPVPAALVGWVGVCLVALMGIIDPKPAEGIKWALSGFSNSIIWLIFGAFMFCGWLSKNRSW